jgi:chromosome partitioning protein
MSDVPPEVVARGRAIFERLRGAPAEGSDDASSTPDDPGTHPAPDPAAPADPAPTAMDSPDSSPATDALAPDEAATDLERASEADDAVPVDGPSDPPTETPAASESASDSVVDEINPDAEVPSIEASIAPLTELEDAVPPTEVAVDPEGSAAEPPPVVDDRTPPTVEPEPEPAGAAPEPAPAPAEPAAAAARTPDARSVTGDGATGRFERPLPRIIAVCNQKGGVGKTTTAVNLAACLADLGFRVLVIDLDPQGNASTGVGVDIRDLSSSMYDVLLHDAPMEDCIEATSVRNLYVAPANLDLAGAEIELVPAFSRELKLRAAIDTVRDDYDFVFIDCPPSLGLLTVNSLAAASEVLVPIQCEYYALEGLGQLLRNVGLVQKNLNPTLEVSVIVCVMYDARTKLADQVVAEVRSHFAEKVCRTVVPRTVRLSEAPSYGQPISAFDPSSRGAIAYRELAKEVSGGNTPRRAG